MVRNLCNLVKILFPNFNSVLFCALAAFALQGCASTRSPAPAGLDAYKILEQTYAPAFSEYRIGPFDTLSINVFQEPDLTFEEIVVDSSGTVPFPLIGSLKIQGMTSSEASQEIAARLGSRYIRDPQVTVFVKTSSAQRLTVEGEVNKSGIFPIDRPISLIQSIALAGGVTENAKMDEVIVFRHSDKAVFAARFDFELVRKGLQPDPSLQPGDIVVVGYSNARGLVRDFLQTAPLLTAIFVRLY